MRFPANVPLKIRLSQKDFIHIFPRQLHVGIVGSGPAGFYTAQHLLKHADNPLSIDMFERLPIPFGLARYGVAPDHPEVKNVIQKFTAIAQDPRFRFFGNVQVGKDIACSNLKQYYDALVLCNGSNSENTIGLNGEDHIGHIFSSRKFVGWYNGLPEFAQLDLDLSRVHTAAIIGQGNVALDVARILVAPIEHLEKTDICEHSLNALRKSAVRRVHVIGRRGPLEVAFTTKELRELFQLEGVKVYTDKALLESEMERNKLVLSKDRARRRLLELLLKNTHPIVNLPHLSDTSTKSIVLDFLKSPRKIASVDSHGSTRSVLSCASFDLNELVTDDTGRKVAKGTGLHEDMDVQLLVSSIGFRNSEFDPSVPFDSRKSIIPNDRGRVIDKQGNIILGMYTAGWIKTGPRGTIASTLFDATETGDMIIEDAKLGKLSGSTNDPKSIVSLLAQKQIQYTTFSDWEKLDEYERHQGETLFGKPREKVTRITDMLRIIQDQAP